MKQFVCKVCGANFEDYSYENRVVCSRECRTKLLTRHGCARRCQPTSPAYRAWYSMIGRCENPHTKYYGYYGGRGIKVCERWHHFQNFLADMGETKSGLTLDRFPNKNGNYAPGNCRWATRKEQANNRKDNVLVTFNGTTQTVSQWASSLGMSHNTLKHRIFSAHWPLKDALTIRASRSHAHLGLKRRINGNGN